MAGTGAAGAAGTFSAGGTGSGGIGPAAGGSLGLAGSAAGGSPGLGTGGAISSSGAAAIDAPATPSVVEGGCACVVAGQAPRSAATSLLALAPLALLGLRRRRRPILVVQ